MKITIEWKRTGWLVSLDGAPEMATTRIGVALGLVKEIMKSRSDQGTLPLEGEAS